MMQQGFHYTFSCIGLSILKVVSSTYRDKFDQHKNIQAAYMLPFVLDLSHE